MSKSPLKSAPLHNPGQSLDNEINRLMDDEVSKYALACVFTIVLALLEWWRWYVNQPPKPVIYSLLALIIVPICAYKLSRLRRQLKQLKLGRDGERAVGQYLEELRVKGYRILHDIVGNGFNADHVVISPHGIFSIETRTISKPEKGEAKVHVTGDGITLNGLMMDRNPLVQAKAAAAWVADLLKESTGKVFQVRPVVVFPGLYVEGKHPEVWVLNPKALPTYIENVGVVLNPEDVQLATYHMARYIRTLQ